MVKQNGNEIPVPCGRCAKCLKRRASGWSFRLMQQEKISQSAHFITLTYDTRHVHITKAGFMDLNKRDVQLFFKSLRKKSDRDLCKLYPIKYYAVGEYGTRTNRPHYHIILFNAELKLIQSAWTLGQVHYGQVTGASVGYCLKYMQKPKRIPMHRNDDRTPEFGLFSKGLGANYLTPAMVKWHKDDLENRMYCNIEGNKKIAMPRYIKNKLYNETEREQAAFATLQRIRLQEERARQENPLYDQQKISDMAGDTKRMVKNATDRRDKI